MTPTFTDPRPETATPHHDPQAIDPNCPNCGGSGEWTDPQGQKWPCIQCNPIDGDDDLDYVLTAALTHPALDGIRTLMQRALDTAAELAQRGNGT